jgi:hypothetical protein
MLALCLIEGYIPLEITQLDSPLSGCNPSCIALMTNGLNFVFSLVFSSFCFRIRMSVQEVTFQNCMQQWYVIDLFI